MKKLAFISALGALALAGGAFAQTGGSETVTISGPAHKIEIPERHSHMWPEDYRNYQGGYSLSNGKTLSISARGTRMYAEVDDMGKHELVATAANTFVSKDKKLEMTISLHENGEPTGELYMMVPAAAPVAAAPVPAPVPALAVAKAHHAGKTKAGKIAKVQAVKAATLAKAAKPFNGEQMLMVAIR